MAHKSEKPKKTKEKPQISMFRFSAGLVIVVLLFFMLFSAIGVLADAVKYTVEGIETIQRLDQSITASEKSASEIADSYEAELRRKTEFAVYLYENDPELLGLDMPVLLANRPAAFFDQNGEVIVKEKAFPDLSRARIINCIQETDASENKVGYTQLSNTEQMILTKISDTEYVALTDNMTLREYIANNISDARALVKDAATPHSFTIAERNGSYYAGPAWLDVEEGTPIRDVITDAATGSYYMTNGIFAAVVGGKLYYAVTQKTDSGITLYYMLDIDYVFAQSLNTIIAAFAAMICALIVLLYYLISYRRALRYENIPPAEKGFRSRRRILLVLGTVMTALVAYYARTVFCISSYVMDDDKEIEALRESVEENAENCDDVIESFRGNYEDGIEMISRYLAAKPERTDEDTLRKLSDIFGFEYLMIFDKAGNEVISDSDFVGLMLSGNRDDLSYNIRSILRGSYVNTFDGLDDLTGEYRTYTAAAIYGGDGMINSAVIGSIPDDHERQIRQNNSVFAIMDEWMASGQTKYYLLDKEGQYFFHTPNEELDTLNPADYGFTEEVLREGFSGRVTVSGVPYYMTQGELDGYYIYTAIPTSVVYGTRIPYTIASAAVAFLILVYAARRAQRLKIVHVSAGTDPAVPPKAEGEGFANESPQPPVRPVSSESGLPASPEEKTTRLILRICQTVGVVITVILLFRDTLVPKDSMIHRVLEGGWQHGLNIYAVTAVLILILTVVIGVSMIIYVLKILARILSPRGETVCRLLRSAVEYFSVILVAYIGFGYLGVRVEALITTASILTLLVGMGAQDLTADIIAGLFLMFESEFQVGDVIDTGGKIGIVKEIGIHSTKLIDFNNNVLIISNSNLADIVNRTQRNSFAFTDFKVSADVKIADLETLFAKELPPLKTAYPKFIGEPYFRGVSEFSGNTMKCSIAAEVSEKDRVPMERILNREVLRILKNADITPL